MSEPSQTHIELAFRYLYDKLQGESRILSNQPWHCQVKTSSISSSALAQILSVMLSNLPFTFSDTVEGDLTRSIIYSDVKPTRNMIASIILIPASAIEKDFKVNKRMTKESKSFIGIDGQETYAYLWATEKALSEGSHRQTLENVPAQLTRPDIFPTVNTLNHPVPLYTISFTSEALYSATPLKANELMVADIVERLKGVHQPIMLDGTANCGADTIGCLYNSNRLGRPFKMISIELDELNCQSLEDNVSLFGYKDRVKVICGDTLEWLSHADKNKVDVLYFDPPWGGKDYKKEQEIRLKLGDESIWNVARTSLEDKNLQARLVVVKAPFNFDRNEVSFQAIKNRCEIKMYPVSKNIAYIFMGPLRSP